VSELFQEDLSSQFPVATRRHILLPLPPSEIAVALSAQTELEASGSKAKGMEKIGNEARMQIPGVSPRCSYTNGRPYSSSDVRHLRLARGHAYIPC